LHMSRKVASRILFASMVVLSMVALVVTTSNYVTLFAGIKNLELRLNEIDFALTPDGLNVTVGLKVSNPSSYGGFELKSVYGTLFYEGKNHRVMVSPGRTITGGAPYQVIETPWWELPPHELAVNQPLPPYSSKNLLMELKLKGESAEAFRDFYETLGKYQDQINWELDCRVSLQTPSFFGVVSIDFQELYP